MNKIYNVDFFWSEEIALLARLLGVFLVGRISGLGEILMFQSKFLFPYLMVFIWNFLKRSAQSLFRSFKIEIREPVFVLSRMWTYWDLDES